LSSSSWVIIGWLVYAWAVAWYDNLLHVAWLALYYDATYSDTAALADSSSWLSHHQMYAWYSPVEAADRCDCGLEYISYYRSWSY
jgi:hypothetical protein